MFEHIISLRAFDIKINRSKQLIPGCLRIKTVPVQWEFENRTELMFLDSSGCPWAFCSSKAQRASQTYLLGAGGGGQGEFVQASNGLHLLNSFPHFLKFISFLELEKYQPPGNSLLGTREFDISAFKRNQKLDFGSAAPE